MSLQLLTILSPPTPCTPVLRSLCSPQARSRSCRFPFRVGFRSGLHLTPSRVRQCIRPYRVHHFLNYGLVIRFRLLPTPSLDDAVAFSYGQSSASVRCGLSPHYWCVLSGALLLRLWRSGHLTSHVFRFRHSRRYAPGIQVVPANGTLAMAAASTVKATRSSGSRFST